MSDDVLLTKNGRRNTSSDRLYHTSRECSAVVRAVDVVEVPFEDLDRRPGEYRECGRPKCGDTNPSPPGKADFDMVGRLKSLDPDDVGGSA